MKKRLLALVLGMAMVLGLVACAPKTNGMSYADYMAAADGTECTIVTYVQDKEGWWNGHVTVYTADKNGAYFLYEVPCTEDEAASLVPGTKIEITGTKSTWSGQMELTWDETVTTAPFKVISGDKYVAPAKEVAAAEMVKHPTELVSLKGLEVVASTYKDANDETVEAPFLYKWDNSGAEGDDVYFVLTDGQNNYSFNVRVYLSGNDSDVYKAAQSLKVGDKVDVEAFVYIYSDEAQPRATSIVVK